MSEQSMWNRLALITELAGKIPAEKLGHTAVMKHVYFLKTLRGVPLDYWFSLYIYGPFDSDVLYDLAYAEALQAVQSTMVTYKSGYAYEIRPGPKAPNIKRHASGFLRSVRPHVDWVVKEFGDLNASDLELVSTIVYVDREFVNDHEPVSLEQLTDRVHAVKPHCSQAKVRQKVRQLKSKGLLLSVG